MNNTALILFRALPEFKACAPWIQELAEAAFIRGMEEGKRQCGPNYRQLIEEHNQGCDASCKAQRPSDLSGSSTGCGYQRMDGTLIYNSRRCPNCPQDWKIELPLPATGIPQEKS